MKRRYNYILSLFLALFVVTNSMAQQKPNPMTEKKAKRNTQTTDPTDLNPIIIDGRKNSNQNPHGILTMPERMNDDAKTPQIQVLRDNLTGLPIMIKGEVSDKTIGGKSTAELEAASFDYLENLKSTLHLKQPNKEFKITNVDTDRLQQTHIKLQQYYQGVEVYGGELILHTASNGNKINLLNGRYYPTPQLQSVTPALSADKAIGLTREKLKEITKVRALTPQEEQILNYKKPESRIIIFHKSNHIDSARLAYHVTIRPNFMERWEYFIDAQSGDILFKFDHTCTFFYDASGVTKEHEATCSSEFHHKASATNTPTVSTAAEDKLMDGPVTATANDLFGISRNINVYEVGGTYFFIDGSRPMFNLSQSNMPDNPVGAIWTIDGQNGSPQGGNFQVAHVTSTNNTWSNPTAVSAHYNGSESYEYFTTTHSRNSINGSGGTIISIINITDENGNQMDNAFWNGQAIFYGNGNTAFQPLAKSLDVAGHEMSHGVVTNTANLQYYGQSGALNESFADIFGVMIDRDDWLLGDDVANTTVFPTGALRSMSDPNNGGSSLNDPGYQPKHMNSIFTGSADNGGVHINSGIPNHAFYKYALVVGKDKAEDVYYRALTTYLTSTSQFVDARVAVMQSAEDLFGAGSTEVTEAGLAFDAVGITGSGGGGGGGGGNPGGGGGSIDPDNLYPVNGPEYILSYNTGFFNFHTLQVTDPQGGNVIALSNTPIGSKPSVTDNGSYTVYTGTNNQMYGLQLDGTSTESVLSSNTIWTNVIISKDGSKIAAVTNNTDTSIWVYDFPTQQWGRYYLYNPTFTQGVSSGDVLYADAMEWDYSGEYIIYDALNRINAVSGTPIEYWDVGVLRVWDDSLNTFGDGTITKLFSNLPQGVSIGNPSLAKNSAYIIAFDYIDEPNNDFKLIAADLITNQVGVIYTNSDLSFPNYSTYDDQIIFDAEDFFGDDIIGVIDVQADKITPTGSAVGLVNEARWGVWFAQGNRDSTVATKPILSTGNPDAPQVFPNPFSNKMTISYQNETGEDVTLTIFNIDGAALHTEIIGGQKGLNVHDLNLKRFETGIYIIHTTIGDKAFVNKVMKQ